jgi:FkbM family methyltransferase
MIDGVSAGLPPIVGEVPFSWFLGLRRACRRTLGRELGFAHSTRALARILPAWQALPLQGPDGLALVLDLRMREGYFVAGFENTTGHMDALLNLVDDDATVIDVGANIGVWSRQLLSRRRLRALVAFEPDGRNFELLARNLNGYANARCEPFAVSDACGTAAFSTDRDSGQNHLVVAGSGAIRGRRVSTITLDDWLQSWPLDRLDLLKVDVEGFELHVFRGATRMLERFRPVLYFEYVPAPGGDPLATPCRELLTSLGYEIYAVLLDGRIVKERGAELIGFSHDLIGLPVERISEFAFA